MSAAAAPLRSLPSRTAFLVEDDPRIRTGLGALMAELLDIRVVQFADTEQAARHWIARHGREVDLIVLDMALARGTGLGVLRKMRDAGIDTPAVVLTNDASATLRAACEQAGADAFFDKTGQIDEFLDHLRLRH